MTQEKVEFWGIVELFGHSRIAGLVSETSIGGCSFIRIDVPANDKSPALTKFYGNGAIYSMTVVSEEVVHLFVKHNIPAPINVWIPEIRQIENGKPNLQPINNNLEDDDDDSEDDQERF